MAWALENPQARELAPPPVFSTLESLQNAVDHTHPEEWYPTARMLRRKIHMHVGPTNSGKTHNALRALAASRRGVYASPLRLLAYEIFDRLNNGRIVPLGADPSAPPETFKRLCNLVTGEEVRMISEDANLLSCTVEMIDTSKRYEVAVVDEIQMLSDPERGGAWTAAVLGLHAEEIHLCGEAGAVPLVQEMLKDVGDELIVHRYERLTPLTVASKSLKGDLTKIQKGDCVVSFSRSMLFSLKEQIEEATGMRCAIIYGRLPPEVRSEQAERFNDPDSGYDVLVGSDAIGMGLNLKIKRIVFESSQKWDGTNQRALSLSQLKQIAGRAGRFGMHGTDTDPGGVVTTIHERDLPTVRKAVESRSVPVSKRAILPTTQNMFHSLEQLVRPQKQKQTKFSAVFDILRSTARLAPCYALRDLGKMAEDVVPVIDTYCKDFTLEERLRVFLAPVIWRDGAVKMAAKRFINSYRKEMHVKLFECLRGVGLLEARDFVRDARAKEASSKSSSSSSSSSSEGVPPLKIDTLLKLESLYRVVVVYMWFSLRLPLAFPERERAVKLKEEVEEGIEWTLQRMQAMAMQGRVEDDEEGLGESESEEKDVLDDEIMEEQLEDEYEDEDEDGDEDESGDEAVVVRSRSKEASGVAFTV
ncbi:P-loop containing nucleoside triphosphate hydrolase protein [Fomitiporia mediterranea MF3/22]|uniref:P-loop containing nucleoside triphosphate hydrolase protein n=1 Tax=Fomitiporia mediterranea (strain MF3/22) TaxID=694068 RepID=UPI00044095B2|nr:P-loop containing nucleoside triphosphate hydrolase protein [Fomitiporia mediterranea MF3/22]EJD06226.1 P-loop containing nucleoside triphosphate hydrolase protein [Fomitiporia mediterranea MF3/22]